MPRAETEILKQALALPTEARASLIDSLLDSLDPNLAPNADPNVNINVDELWEAEILRRAKQLDEGTAKVVLWQELRAKLTHEPEHGQ